MNTEDAIHRESTAYHEAGHAVASHVLGLPIRSATIVSNGDYEGMVRGYAHSAIYRKVEAGESLTLREQDRCFRWIIMMLAGSAAEQKHARVLVLDYSWEQDRENATDYAMLVTGGDTEEASRLIAWLSYRAERLVAQSLHWHMIARVAALLVQRNTLKGAQVHAACKNAVRDYGERLRVQQQG